MSADDATGKVTTRLKDPELATALEDAAEEVGSKSKIVRSALEEKLLSESTNDGGAADLSQKAERGLLALKENTGPQGMIELGAAKSIVANECNIKADHCRFQVFEPLRRAGKIAVLQGIQSTSIEVLDDGE